MRSLLKRVERLEEIVGTGHDFLFVGIGTVEEDDSRPMHRICTDRIPPVYNTFSKTGGTLDEFLDEASKHFGCDVRKYYEEDNEYHEWV